MARGNLVWLDGKILPEEETRISLFTHALHYGVGVFEGIRAYEQKDGKAGIFRLKEHMDRFVESWKILGIPLPYTSEQLCQAAVEITQKNGFKECYIRPIGFIGEGPLGIHPGNPAPVRMAILNWEWGSYLGDEGVSKGVRLKTSSFIRPHVNSIMTRGKITGQYVTSVLAKSEAINDGYDEGLFLDKDGFLAEGSGENIFMVKDGIVKTTPLTAVLSGITRQTVIQHLRHKGYTVEEQRFTRDELWCADEVFLTGTAAEITPVREIDHRIIGNGTPGSLSVQMKEDYAAMVRGNLPEYAQNWITTF
ncbi:MAG: branched chain amino acid aminotransferase [Bdellovibrionaceae bacterium]|nr:branched chain amino acid aminotransferase [Pseudobdellovibrionaceae bacterium]|tara:strand:+ start:803 stop:1723 length:921 start_codon:yes stop_codon:yes gene_type:complete